MGRELVLVGGRGEAVGGSQVNMLEQVQVVVTWGPEL